MTTPNRKDARDDVVTLISTLAGSGKTLQKVVNGLVEDEIDGASPVVTVASAGSSRDNMIRNTAQADNLFRFEVVAWVAYDTTDAADKLDDIEQEMTALFANPVNAAASDASAVPGAWVLAYWEDGYTQVTYSKPISGIVYLMEIRYLIVKVW